MESLDCNICSPQLTINDFTLPSSSYVSSEFHCIEDDATPGIWQQVKKKKKKTPTNIELWMFHRDFFNFMHLLWIIKFFCTDNLYCIRRYFTSPIRPIWLPNTQKGYKNAIYYDAAANFRGNALLQATKQQLNSEKLYVYLLLVLLFGSGYHAVRPGANPARPGYPVKQGLRK